MIPGAIARPISRNYTPRKRSRTDAVILHVAVSRARSLHGWFNNPTARASSHLYIRKDGSMEQYVSHESSAWTSGAGSYRSIGIETEGMGVEPWTAAQCETLARVLAWAHKTYGVPLALMDSSAPRARGTGWHRLGVPMTRAQLNRGISYTGGELWSRAVGKTCPGSACIAQIPAIVSRARILAGLDKPAPKPKPTPAEALAEAGILIGDLMKNVGIYTNRADGTRVYAILNPTSGFFHKFTGGTGKTLAGTYVNPLAAAFDTGSWPFVTQSHMDVIEEACALVRAGLVRAQEPSDGTNKE